MAAPLTTADRRTVFKILRAFWSGGNATITNGFGVVMTVSDLDTLTDLIDAKLDSYIADDAACTDIQTLVTQWDLFSGMHLEGPVQVGSISANISLSEIRNQIKQELHTYVPIMTMGEGLAKRKDAERGGGAGFGIGR